MIRIMKQTEIAPGLWGQPILCGWTLNREIADRSVAERNESEKYQSRRPGTRVRYFTVTEAGTTAN